MASLADKNLPQAAQDQINQITANAQAGKISWSDANKQANQIRQENGADYTVSAKGTTTYDDNSTISNFKSGSQTSGGKASNLVNDWNSNANVSTDKDDYYSSGVTANMSRNQALAGQSVKQGQYTVTYNENGYAVKAVKDGGKSATSSVATTHANDSAYHQAAYQAALMGDWDLVGQYLNKISETFGKVGENDGYNTGLDLKAANLYGSELQNQFKYNAKDYYDSQYDKAYGNGSAAVWDATGGAIKSYGDLVAILGEQGAQQFVSQGAKPTSNTAAMQDLSAMFGMSGGTPSSAGMSGFSADMGNYGDLAKYLQDMYTSNVEAELAALKSAYDTNVAELESQNDIIAQQYRAARNQAAQQNELERMRFNEYAVAQGLNTGTAGQSALAQSAAHQGNLGNLWAQEAQSRADNELAMAQLAAQYNNTAQQAAAQGQAQLAEALYNEYVRQQEMAYEQQRYQQQVAQQNQDTAREYALSMLSNGAMPDSNTLAAAGISDSEALLWQALANGGTASSVQYSAAPSTQTAASPTVKRPGSGGGYNNGTLSTAQVKQLQADINKYLPEGQKIAEDGLWGSATSNAVGGMTADQYANIYYKQNSWSGRSDR